MNPLENRKSLAALTKAYFKSLDAEAAREENDLAAFLSLGNGNIDVDNEI